MKFLLKLYTVLFGFGTLFFSWMVYNYKCKDVYDVIAGVGLILSFAIGFVLVLWSQFWKKTSDEIEQEEIDYWMQRLEQDEEVDLSIHEQYLP